ncbi:MAG: hypothetical protein K6F68_07425 [Clostridiales bacterium]|nr:hypothetical protein [Clostridiales bacterium]
MDPITILIIAACAAAVILVVWIVYCAAKLKCAKKFGLRCGWMAFLPFLSSYLDGRIAEASDRLLKPGKKRYRRWGRRNLCLRILCAVFASVFLGAVIAFSILVATVIANELSSFGAQGIVGKVAWVWSRLSNLVAFIKNMSNDEHVSELITACIIIGSVILVSVIIFFIAHVYRLMLRYKLYAAFNRNRAGVQLVLSFFLIPATAFIMMGNGFSKRRMPVFAPYPEEDLFALPYADAPEMMTEGAPEYDDMGLSECVLTEDYPVDDEDDMGLKDCVFTD